MYKIKITKIEHLEDYYRSPFEVFHKYALHRDDNGKSFEILITVWYSDGDNEVEKTMYDLADKLIADHVMISNITDIVNKLKDIEQIRYGDCSQTNGFYSFEI